MKLSGATKATLTESKFFRSFNEDVKVPLWSFQYDHSEHDKEPEIVLLGAYKNQNTNNNLVGGINLNYLDKQQRAELVNHLPRIMSAGDLYSRYHIGSKLVPSVFKNAYRTYDSNYIRGVTPRSVNVPDNVTGPEQPVPVDKQIPDFRTDMSGQSTVKPKQIPDKQTSGQQDLMGMNKVVNNVNRNLGQTKPMVQKQFEQPELQIARDLYNRTQDQQQTSPEMEPNQIIDEPSPEDMGDSIEKERLENREELLDPDNDIDLNVKESIRYYSPIHGRYITESIIII